MNSLIPLVLVLVQADIYTCLMRYVLDEVHDVDIYTDMYRIG